MRVWIGVSIRTWKAQAKTKAATTPPTHRPHWTDTGRAKRAINTLATPNQAIRTTSLVMNIENETCAAFSIHFEGRGVGVAPAARMMVAIQVSETRACLSKYWTKASSSAAAIPAQPASFGAIQTFCANQASAMPRKNRGRARKKPKPIGIW